MGGSPLMANEESKNLKITRRAFARGAALAATAACLPTQLLSGGQPAVPLPQQPGDEKLSAEGQAEADAKVQAIFRKYGDRLSEAQKADVRRLVTEGQKPLETMRKFALENGDQPGNVLRLYPDAAAARGASSH
jgi:hypothetical protein